MTDIDIFKAIGQLDCKYVIEADPAKAAPARRFWGVKRLTVAACLIVALALSFGYIVNDYDYLAWSSNIGDDHIVQYPSWIGESTSLFSCGLENPKHPLAVETLCSDDTKFLVEFIVTGKAYEKTVKGEAHTYLPVVFDKPVFKGRAVKKIISFERRIDITLSLKYFEDMPKGARFLAFLSIDPETGTPRASHDAFYIDSKGELVSLFKSIASAYNGRDIKAYDGYDIDEFEAIALMYYNENL